MPDSRSREGWSDSMENVPPTAPAHVHRLPKMVRVALVGLAAAVFLLIVAVTLVSVYAARMEAENTERTRRAACDLLDTFPADLPSLERARQKYECGDGIPRSQLSPEEQQRLPQMPASPTSTD